VSLGVQLPQAVQSLQTAVYVHFKFTTFIQFGSVIIVGIMRLIHSFIGIVQFCFWLFAGESRWVCKTVLEGAHHRTIRCVSWSPCGRLLAASSFDGTTSVWSSKSLSDFECIATLEGHENEVKSVVWSASGAYLATCSRDKSVWIFEGEYCHSTKMSFRHVKCLPQCTVFHLT